MLTMEERTRVLEGAEAHAATTWLEAAERLLDYQGARWKTRFDEGFADRAEARRHLLAIEKIRGLLRSDKKLAKTKVPYEETTDPLVRRMRRADLLCPRGWREGIRELLVNTADASEREYLKLDGPGLDQDIVDAVEIRAFVTELDFVANRGETARREYSRRAMKVA